MGFQEWIGQKFEGFQPPPPVNPESVLAAGLTGDDIQVAYTCRAQHPDSHDYVSVRVTQGYSNNPDLALEHHQAAEQALKSAWEPIGEARKKAVAGVEGETIHRVSEVHKTLAKREDELGRELRSAAERQTAELVQGRVPSTKGRTVQQIEADLRTTREQKQVAGDLLTEKGQTYKEELRREVEAVRKTIIDWARLRKRIVAERLMEYLLKESKEFTAAHAVEVRFAGAWDSERDLT